MDGGKLVVRWFGVAMADAVALLALRPDWPRLASDLAAPHRWLERVGADRAALALAMAALWCVAVWLGVGLIAIAATSLPGCAGAAARRVATRLLPAVLLRAVAGVAGFGVLVAPVAAGAKTPASARAVSVVVPAPSWPTDPAPGLHIGWPNDPRPPAPPPRASPPSPSTASRPSHPPAPPQAGEHTNQASHGPADPSADHPVRVTAGDSLWLIAAQRLGPNATDAQIAATWPQWYAANRPVIGDDPSLLQPGQMLHAPPPTDAPQ